MNSDLARCEPVGVTVVSTIGSVGYRRCNSLTSPAAACTSPTDTA
ncbi:MAG: hypothetical protein V9E93_03205 [Steroidobacteraceae bacterium]